LIWKAENGRLMGLVLEWQIAKMRHTLCSSIRLSNSLSFWHGIISSARSESMNAGVDRPDEYFGWKLDHNIIDNMRSKMIQPCWTSKSKLKKGSLISKHSSVSQSIPHFSGWIWADNILIEFTDDVSNSSLPCGRSSTSSRHVLSTRQFCWITIYSQSLRYEDG
jgi:hypothetical protein